MSLRSSLLAMDENHYRFKEVTWFSSIPINCVTAAHRGSMLFLRRPNNQSLDLAIKKEIF